MPTPSSMHPSPFTVEIDSIGFIILTSHRRYPIDILQYKLLKNSHEIITTKFTPIRQRYIGLPFDISILLGAPTTSK